ncbi:MAG: hypothetical protein J7M32_06220 [Deltaproteobacteria bacterium]|nr:hypothetical protein [Deltaproteobacteria bacterium]
MILLIVAAAALLAGSAMTVSAGTAGALSILELLKLQDMQRALQYEQLKETGGQFSSGESSLRRALPPDADDDGIPDSWETTNELNPNDPNDAWFDPDRDEVVNLFEYQLGSGLNNPASPPVATVGAAGADYADVDTAIASVAPGTAIRVAGGTYAVNYMTFSSKVIMIQGGWSADFSRRDLAQYATTFDGGMRDEILYFSVSSGNPVIILDGLHFVGGNGYFGAVNLLSSGSSFMKTSVVNCSITQSRSDASYGGVLRLNNWNISQSDRTIANTVIGGNEGSGICAQITDDTTARWRIINTTISQNMNNGDNGYGIESFTLDNGVLTSHIYNSILWGNEQEDISIRRNITFNVDHSDIGDVDANFGAVYSAAPGVVDTNPLFVDPANGDFHLQGSSPVIDAGTPSGVPLTDMEGNPRISGTTVDMGPYEYGGQIIDPLPDIKANGQDGPVTVSSSTPVSITVALDPGSYANQNADWWIAADTPFAPPGDWYTYVYPSGWFPGINLCAQAGLFDLSPFEMLNMTLPTGDYTFYFAIDDPDGMATGPWWGLDSVEVQVE